jgi:hypothetical protein
MRHRVTKLLGMMLAVVLVASWTMPLNAQTEVKEKAPMYSYVGNWAIPRAQWAGMDKGAAADDAILQKALASGTIIGYGNERTIVHQSDGMTHDDWWSSMSMAGLITVLEQFYASGNSTTPALESATKHTDTIYVSRYYNYESGSWKGLYGHGSVYRLKADAPDNAVEMIAKDIVGPLMENMLANGTIYEREIDTEAIHTEAPGMFFVYYLCSNAQCLDTVNAGLREAGKANPLRGPAMSTMIDYTTHRDVLLRSDVTYK